MGLKSYHSSPRTWYQHTALLIAHLRFASLFPFVYHVYAIILWTLARRCNSLWSRPWALTPRPLGGCPTCTKGEAVESRNPCLLIIEARAIGKKYPPIFARFSSFLRYKDLLYLRKFPYIIHSPAQPSASILQDNTMQPPPMFAMALHGARRCQPIQLPWKLDVEKFSEKAPNLFGLHVDANLVLKYGIEEPAKSGEFFGWSILIHCHTLKKRRGGKSIDWDGMETELRVPAEEIVKEELCYLKAQADVCSGWDRTKALEKIEHRKLMLLLGENVLLEEHNSFGKGYITFTKGVLEEFGNDGLFIGDMRAAVDEDDLVKRNWRVTKIEQEKGKGNEGKETEGSHTDNSNEEGYELVDEEGEKRKDKGKKAKRSHIEGDSWQVTGDGIDEWLGRLSVDEKKTVLQKATRSLEVAVPKQ
jgi:hypothetical protein